jgi:phage-related protein
MANYNLGEARGKIVLETDFTSIADGQEALEKLRQQADKSGEAAAKSMQASRDGLDQTSKASLVAGGAIAAGLAVAVNAASEFEFQMSAIQAVSGATAEEMDLINEAALRIGKDTAYSATEAGLAMEELVKAGISVEDTLNGAADATVALAAAGGVDLPTAATIASNAMNQFNLAADDLVGVTDTIAGAANASAIDVEQFAYSMSQSGAVASLVGMSFDDMALAIAAMGNAGIVGSDAGTSLKSMLMNLQPTTKKQRGLFDDLGLSTYDTAKAMQFLTEQGIKPAGDDVDTLIGQIHDLARAQSESGETALDVEENYERLLQTSGVMSNAFYDQEGNLKSLAEISGVLGGALEGMTKQQQQATLETLFGSDAIRAGAIIAETGAEGFEELSAAIGKVSAADVAATRMDNFKGTMEAFQGSLETLAIRIGQALLPMINAIIKGFSAFIDILIAAPDWVIQVGAAFAAVSAAVLIMFGVVGQAFILFGNLRGAILAMTGATTLFGKASAFAAAKAKVLAAWTAVVNAVMNANVFVRIAAIVLALAAAVITMAGGWDEVKKAFEPAVKSFQKMLAKLQPMLEKVSTAITGLLSAALDALMPIIEAVVDVLLILIDSALAALMPIVEAVAEVLLAVLGPALDVVMAVIDALIPIIEALLGAFEPVLDFLISILVPVLDVVVGAIKILADAISWVADQITSAFKGEMTPEMEEFANFIRPFYNENIKPFVDDFMRGVEILSAWVSDRWVEMQDALEGFSTWWDANVGPEVESSLADMQSTFDDALNNIGTFWQNFLRGLDIIGTYWDSNVQPEIEKGLEKAKKSFEDFVTGVGIIWLGFQTITQPLKDWWNDVFAAMEKDVKDFNKGIQIIKTQVSAAWEYIKARMEPIIDRIKNELLPKLREETDRVREKFEEVRDKIVAAWERISEKLQPIVKKIEELVKKVGDTLGKLFGGNAEKDTSNARHSGYGKAADDTGDAFDDLMDTLDSAITTFSTVVDVIIAIITPVADAIIAVLDGVATFVEGVENAVNNFVTWWNAEVQPTIDFILGLMDGGETSGEGSQLSAPFVAGQEAAQKFKDFWDSTMTPFFAGVEGAMSDPFKAAGDAISGAWNNMLTTVSTVANGMWAIILTVFTRIGTWINTTMNGVRTNLTNIWNNIGSIIGQRVQAVRDAISRGWANLAGVVGKIMRDVRDNVKGAIDGAVNAVQGFRDRVVGFFSSAGTWLIQAGKNIINGLWNGLKSIWSSVQAWFSNITAMIPKIKGPPERDKTLLEPAGGLLMAGLLNGLMKGWEPVRESLSDMNVGIPAEFTQNITSGLPAGPTPAAAPSGGGQVIRGNLYLSTGEFLGIVDGRIDEKDNEMRTTVRSGKKGN